MPESFLFQTIIDVDDKEYVEKAIEKARELNCSSGIWSEQALLRKEYIDNVRQNLRNQLNNINIQNEDGSIENLGEHYGSKNAQ